jgi:transposase
MPLSSPSLTLSETDQASLQTFVHRGRANARTLTRAHILLKLAEGWSEAELCAAFDVCRNTVVRVLQRYLEGGLEAVLQDKRQQRYRQALTGTQAAYLIATACSPVPDGHDHWTLRMLAGKAVELGFVSGISHETIRQVLKKTSSNPGSMSSGVSHPWERSLWPRWKMSWRSMKPKTPPNTHWSVSMRNPSSYMPKPAQACPSPQASLHAAITSMSVRERPISL